MFDFVNEYVIVANSFENYNLRPVSVVMRNNHVRLSYGE